MKDKAPLNPNKSNEIYDVYLTRYDEPNGSEVERVLVYHWADTPEPNGTIGGLCMALNYTTSYISQPNGEQFDIIRVRNDPFTEEHITPDVFIETIDAPGEEGPQLPTILERYKNLTNYEPVQVG